MKSLTSHKTIMVAVVLAVLSLVACIYWPVRLAGFVWDDKICFHNVGWLWSGSGWKRLIFRNFYEWINYFRPLVVAFFVFEVRTFSLAAGPMHLVSLVMHLVNTMLVGLLALSLRAEKPAVTHQNVWLIAIAMLLYSLHPALIEPVVWISCQFEQMLTFFMLLALLFNATLRHTASRAIAVATCFFLAACAKESAVSLPLLLVLFDWMRKDPQQPDVNPLAWLLVLWRRQWLVYLCVLVAGFAYLALRYWAMGYLLQPSGGPALFSFARLQTVSFLYLTYWRIVVWPMIGLGPIHEVDAHQFAMFDATAAIIDFVALAIFFCGLYLAWKRRPIGCLILAVTVALLPVLHIVPIDFDISLYHERYAMTAVAMVCALLPWIVSGISVPAPRLRSVGMVASAIVVAWLGLAIMNIRATVPLWSDEAKLWLWALREHPESLVAKDHLLSTYLELNDLQHARLIADTMMTETRPCPICMINTANLAMADGNLDRAAAALEKARQTIPRQGPKSIVQPYILALGQLFEMKHDPNSAEAAYRDAIAMEPLEPQAQMNLALLLARQGKMLEARKQAGLALSLYAPDQREAERRRFEAILTASIPLLARPMVRPEHEN